MLQHTRPAPLGADGASPAWDDFRVDDPAQVLRWLRQLRDDNVPVTLSGPHGHTLGSQLWSLDEAHGQLNFSADAGAAQLQRLLQGDELTAVAYLDSVKLQFDLFDVVLVHGAKACALRAQVPAQVYRFQRRGSYRVRALERHTPNLRLRHPSMPDMQLRLRIVDVSVGGCALALPDDMPALQPGSCLHGVRVEIDANTAFTATLRLQHLSTLHGGGAGARLGCEWLDLDGAAQRALQRYIDHTQQRRRVLASR
jgi:c-di-GMP-binding flagellar brake protein YcgR